MDLRHADEVLARLLAVLELSLLRLRKEKSGWHKLKSPAKFQYVGFVT